MRNSIQNQIFDGFDFHSLRQTYATKLVESWLSIAAIQQRLGDINLDMTLMYASHVSNQMNEKEIQALNQIYQQITRRRIYEKCVIFASFWEKVGDSKTESPRINFIKIEIASVENPC